MTVEDVSTPEPVPAVPGFDRAMNDVESLIEGLKGGDPAEAAEPAARLGDILSALLEAEDEGSGA